MYCKGIAYNRSQTMYKGCFDWNFIDGESNTDLT